MSAFRIAELEEQLRDSRARTLKACREVIDLTSEREALWRERAALKKSLEAQTEISLRLQRDLGNPPRCVCGKLLERVTVASGETQRDYCSAGCEQFAKGEVS